MKKAVNVLIILLLLGGIVKSQTCIDLPDKFYSYSQAISSIKTAKFKFIDKLPLGKSSWIASATYYSCNGVIGYLVYTTDKGKDYLHENIPVQIWTEFKNANSSGSYYNRFIKGKYRLVINKNY